MDGTRRRVPLGTRARETQRPRRPRSRSRSHRRRLERPQLTAATRLRSAGHTAVAQAKPRDNPLQGAGLVELHRRGQHTSADLAEPLGVARSTVYRALQRADGAAPATRAVNVVVVACIAITLTGGTVRLTVEPSVGSTCSPPQVA